MASPNGKPYAGGRSALNARFIDFDRTKYGPELLIDVAWVHEMPAFLLGELHVLRFYDITLVSRGRGKFWLDGHCYQVRPGMLLFSTPGQARRWEVDGLDGQCLFFPAPFLTEFFQDAQFLERLPYFHVREGRASIQLSRYKASRYRQTLTTMQSEIGRPRSEGVHLLRARLYEVLITLARDYSETHRVAPEQTLHPMVLRFTDLLAREFSRHHSVSAYATELGISDGHLSTLCRNHLGTSAKAVIQERLTSEARRMLLYSDHSAERIAQELGFEDPSYFTRFFRLATGRTPSRFRKESRLVTPH